MKLPLGLLASACLWRACGALLAPTNQPASLGQDQQECGFLLLPDRLQIWPRSSRWTRAWSAAWESMDRATFVTCYQGQWIWSPEAVHCYVDSKLLYSSETFRDSAGLPFDVRDLGNVSEASGRDSVVFRDCRGELQYVAQVVEAKSGHQHYTVFNREGSLVAERIEADDYSRKDLIRFVDTKGYPVAVAQSPVLDQQESYPFADPSRPDAAEVAAAAQTEGGEDVVRVWQLMFFDAYTTESTLIYAQNRWLLAAVTQDFALRGIGGKAAPGIDGPELLRFMAPFLVLFGLFASMVLGFALLFQGCQRDKVGHRFHEALALLYSRLPA